ncbi:MAG: hypothetical protein HY423_03070 [Candidatus Lambdaproteobacteria bacterium]|nr:hypothetical protein [Candidatus Lambdaproteobacteria bacterium]
MLRSRTLPPPPVADIGNRRLVALTLVTLAAVAAYALLHPLLPHGWRTPGTPLLYLTGVAGALLLLVPAAFSWAKRTGRGGSPRRWFLAHIGTGFLGVVLVAVHGAGRLGRPPALLYLALLGLIAVGVWARVRIARGMSATFGSRHPAFFTPRSAATERLRALLDEKRRLLARLDLGAREATFSPTLGHWLRRPRLSFAYARLAREESRLIGTRQAAPLAEAWWRRLHLALGVVFFAGLIAHVVTVTFFAGYVAAGRAISWWHLAEW